MTIEPYEREAILQLMETSKAVASMLGVANGHGRRIAIWVQIVEDYLQKQEDEADADR